MESTLVSKTPCILYLIICSVTIHLFQFQGPQRRRKEDDHHVESDLEVEDFEDENDVVVNKPQKLKGFNQLNVSALETVCILLMAV